MSQRSVEQAAREERLAAIDQCPSCDPSGWRLGLDHTPIDPAVRCDHNAPPSNPGAGRDITQPLHEHELDLFSEPTHPAEAEL